MKSFTFLFICLSMDQKVVLYDCTFEICFVYEIKCGDMMFCNLNFLIKYLTLVNSVLSTGIIVDIIRPLSTRIIVDLYIPWW